MKNEEASWHLSVSYFPIWHHYHSVIAADARFCKNVVPLSKNPDLTGFFFPLSSKYKKNTSACDRVVCHCNNMVAAESLNIQEDSIHYSYTTHNIDILCMYKQTLLVAELHSWISPWIANCSPWALRIIARIRFGSLLASFWIYINKWTTM